MDSIPSTVSSSSSTLPSSSSTTVPSSEQTSYFSCQTEFEMESAKTSHYSELKYSTTHSETLAESNFEYFDRLKNDPQWPSFFMESEGLEVGEKISAGAQADIYEARNKSEGPYNLVVKVMHGNAPLERFQTQWPTGMLSARSKHKLLFDLPLISISGGTVLRDGRLRGRFAFVMRRRWGDLRLLIDRRMKQERSTAGPFPIDEAIHLMLSIAKDMETLHNKYDIIHRDLKASNVLVWGQFGEDMSLVAPPNRVAKIESVVADFECSLGVVGTGFWRAPEILEQVKPGVRSSEGLFTHASDVYSYGMTCYEIVTGNLPSNGLEGGGTKSQILQGQRPELPHDVPQFIRDIIVACWHSDPLERPTFTAIREALEEKRGCNAPSVVIDNISQPSSSIVKVERWNKCRALTLLEVMQKLMDMNLSILKASDLSSTTMQYFEVIDREGRKVEGDESIANISKALSLQGLDKTAWSIYENLDIFVEGNLATLQIYVVEVIADSDLSGVLLTNFSRLFIALNFQVHSAGCWTRVGRVESVIFVEGKSMGTFLKELQDDMEYFQVSSGRLKIIVHKSGTEEFSNLNERLRNLESIDLTLPRSSSSIRILQREESRRFFGSIKVCLIFEKRSRLYDVSFELVNMGYKIVGASMQRDGTNKNRDIDVRTLGEVEWEKICRIERLHIEHGCPEDVGELIVSGPYKELGSNLKRILDELSLLVTRGQVYREFGTGLSTPCKVLQFFVT